MTRIIISIFLSLFWALNSFSQELGTHWICYPLPNDSSEVLFSHTYVNQGRPQQAILSFASPGKLRVYVNERNITQDLCFSNPDTSTVTIQTYDVTRFMRPDSNIIAVWYAPTPGQPISKQLSLEYYGKDHTGRDFYHKADGEWKCHLLEGCYIKREEEHFDARSYDNNWKATDYDRRQWLSPLGAFQDEPQLSTSADMYLCRNSHLQQILLPISSQMTEEGLLCDFERTYQGTIRLTLREAKKGEVLQIGGLTYTCSGEMDEQAFRRFTYSIGRSFTITDNHKLKKIQIMNIEGLDY